METQSKATKTYTNVKAWVTEIGFNGDVIPLLFLKNDYEGIPLATVLKKDYDGTILVILQPSTSNPFRAPRW